MFQFQPFEGGHDAEYEFDLPALRGAKWLFFGVEMHSFSPSLKSSLFFICALCSASGSVSTCKKKRKEMRPAAAERGLIGTNRLQHVAGVNVQQRTVSDSPAHNLLPHTDSLCVCVFVCFQVRQRLLRLGRDLLVREEPHRQIREVRRTPSI